MVEADPEFGLPRMHYRWGQGAFVVLVAVVVMVVLWSRVGGIWGEAQVWAARHALQVWPEDVMHAQQVGALV